ncbi:hypothetical protein Tco_1194303 [Tanacetum coccineum]
MLRALRSLFFRIFCSAVTAPGIVVVDVPSSFVVVRATGLKELPVGNFRIHEGLTCVQNCPLGCDSKINDLNNMYNNLDRLYNDCYIKVQAYQNAVKTLESQQAWYQNNQLAYEEKIRVLQRDLENTSNELKYSEKINAEIKMEKQDLQAKLDNSLSRFVKEGGMNAIPPPITRIFMPSSNQPDIDESKMTYGKKSCESIPVEESLPKPVVIEPKTSENVVL